MAARSLYDGSMLRLTNTINLGVTMGVQLIDGECKTEYSPSASSALVLHSAEQLAYRWSGLSMLTKIIV